MGQDTYSHMDGGKKEELKEVVEPKEELQETVEAIETEKSEA